jgi:hypothetical protein
MSMRAEERPEYTWLRELKATRGEELRRRYGAHSLGIGRKYVAGRPTDDLALIFYVSRKRAAEPGDPDAIPRKIPFKPKGGSKAVLLLTDVRTAAPPEEELV